MAVGVILCVQTVGVGESGQGVRNIVRKLREMGEARSHGAFARQARSLDLAQNIMTSHGSRKRCLSNGSILEAGLGENGSRGPMRRSEGLPWNWGDGDR